MSDMYDDPEMTPVTAFDNVNFTEVGDRIKGRVIRFERIETRYGKVAKYWLFDLERNVERTMLAGAMDLWGQLYKMRPQVGDTLEIELIGIEGRQHKYMVEVTSGEEPL